MKKDQQQPTDLGNKVIELVKPRSIESLLSETSNEVESLCEGNFFCGSGNTGVKQDDLLF